MGKTAKRRQIATKNGEKPHSQQDRIRILKNKHIEDLCDLEARLRHDHELELGSETISKSTYKKAIDENCEKDKIIKRLEAEKSEILDKYRDLQVVFIDIVKSESYKVNRFYVLSEIAKTFCEKDTVTVLDEHTKTDADTEHELHNEEPELTGTTVKGFRKRFKTQERVFIFKK